MGRIYFGAFGADRTLSQGASGSDVKTLQQMLTAAGADTQGVDGVFGANTTAAVKIFQAANGLTVDGVVGPDTWAKLRAVGSSPAGAEVIVMPEETIVGHAPSSSSMPTAAKWALGIGIVAIGAAFFFGRS